MLDPKEFYHTREGHFKAELQKLNRQIAFTSTLRLLVFFLTATGIYLFNSQILFLLITICIGSSGFVYLLLQHQKFKQKRDVTAALVVINQTELKVLQEDYSDLNEGNEFIDSSHFFSFDIDLFGPGSFFQYINRTSTNSGKLFLADILTENAPEQLLLKQETLKELADKPDWIQRFKAVATLVNVAHSADQIANWIRNYKPTLKRHLKWVPTGFSIGSLLLVGLTLLQLIGPQLILLWFFIGLGISAYYFKKVTKLYHNADRSKAIVKQYYQLLQHIESENFKAKILRDYCESMESELTKATSIFAQFSKLLDAFDQRNNIFIALLGNAFFLRDLHLAFRIESWITSYANQVENWFEVIAFFDAYNSLATFVFNHRDYSFPTLVKDDGIKASKLSHPLLKKASRISNDFVIQDGQFYIITGANMAGKSTFLRSVALAILMANIGLPVCAKTFQYTPIKLLTSMRTTDSLAHDESYFYAELKRLKFIVEALQNDHYFIILDEILKGTNSEDKTRGSIQFVERLVRLKATGLIATHDLSLCTIEEQLQEVKNYYFDVEMQNNTLHFDYLLKKGVCKNMNATFLLKQMKIVD